jgi:PAS domain S-box-containing protein
VSSVTRENERVWRENPWRPAIVLLLALAVTTAVAISYSRVFTMEDRTEFGRAVERACDAILNRTQAYVATLRGAAAFFAADEAVERSEFHAYVDGLHLQEEYPGIQGIGFSLRVAPHDLSALVARERASGIADFEIRPEDPRNEYHAILYLEPLDRRNRAAIGYDMYTDPVCRAAMSRARDTGLPSASGPVTLVQEIDQPKQPGFLIYVPVYRRDAAPQSVEERRQALVGYVYAAFRAEDLLRGVFGVEPDPFVDFEIYDGAEPDPEQVVYYRTSPLRTERPRFAAVRRLDIAGHPWTIAFASSTALDAVSKRRLIPVVFGAGAIFSFLLAGIAFVQGRARQTAQRFTRYREAVRHGERLHQIAVEQVRDYAIFRVDPAGRMATWNRGVERVLGWTEADFIGQPYHIIFPAEDVALGLPERELRAARDGEVASHDRWHVRKNGASLWASGTTTILTDEEGRFAGLLVVMRDLTDRKRDEEAVAQLNRDLERVAEQRRQLLEIERSAREEAEHIGRMKDEFLATLSHELRTPLNAILGWSQLLSRKAVDPSKTSRGLDSIARNARAQARIIEDLLDMSRIVSGKVRLEIQPVDPAAIVEAALDVVRPMSEAKGVRLHHAVEPGLPILHADPNRLQQILWNLLTNAIKFTAHGGEVRIDLTRNGDAIDLTVADTGQGIGPEFLPHVFERFRQADASTTRYHGGLGLGLSIVKSLAELHGGLVRASSPGEGRGATFVVSFPIAASRLGPVEPSAFDRHSMPAVTDDHAPPASLAGTSVLVVDDDPEAGEVLRAALQESGAAVSTAVSASEALDVLRRAGPPDVLIADLGMPDVDGYEFIRRIRSMDLDRVALVPAIALTAFAGREERDRALDAGYDLHVAKPVEHRALIEAVDFVRSKPSGRPVA